MYKPSPVNPELSKITKFTIVKKSKLLKNYFLRIEEIFEIESASLEKAWGQEYERTKEFEDDSEIDFSAADSLKDIEFVYIKMHRYSAVLAAYSYLESSLIKICNSLTLENKIPMKLTDLSGGGIVRCREYLKCYSGIDLEKLDNVWHDLKLLNDVRNCIMHADGDAAKVKDSPKLIAKINKVKELSFVEEKLIMVSKEYVKNSIKDIEIFLVALVEKST